MQTTAQIENEITRTQAILEKITGKTIHYFRPPFGVVNPMIARAVKTTNVQPIGWSIRSLDTLQQPVEKVLQRIIRQLKGGDVILLHDNREGAAQLVEALIIYLQKNKYEIVTVSQLIKGNKS